MLNFAEIQKNNTGILFIYINCFNLAPDFIIFRDT